MITFLLCFCLGLTVLVLILLIFAAPYIYFGSDLFNEKISFCMCVVIINDVDDERLFEHGLSHLMFMC